MTTYAAEQATRLYNQQRSLIAQAVIQEGYAARVLGVRKAAYLNRAARLRQEAAALEPARQAAMLAAKADAVAAAEQAKLRLDLQRGGGFFGGVDGVGGYSDHRASKDQRKKTMV